MDWWKCVVVASALASCGDGSDGTGALENDGTVGDDDSTTTSDSAPACGESDVTAPIISITGHGSGAIAGDIDGDGNADALVSVPGYVEDGDAIGPGRVRVVLGPLEGRTGALDDQPGFNILGEHEDHLAGGIFSPAGDVNGDGLADVIVGVLRTCDIDNPCSTGGETDGDCEPPCAPGPYRLYLVHGKTDTEDVELVAVAGGAGGFAIEHSSESDTLGNALVAPAGDVDGDGLADVAIGAAEAGHGRAYVVLGRTDTTAIDLADVAAGEGGFAIDPELESIGYFPSAIAGAGDVDGDGTDDIVVGDMYTAMGRAYVVFAGEAAATVSLTDVAAGVGGFAIAGEPNAGTGTSVAGLGDIDGDGLAEIGVGAPFWSPDGGASIGRAYVVHGTSDTAMVDLAEVAAGSNGFAIQGTSVAGRIVDGGGDHDGDGVLDVLVDDGSATRAFVVAGKSDGELVVLGESGSIEITPPEGGFFPVADSLVPDLNCDGRADVVLHEVYWAESAVAFVLE
jgi:hypothetical protein